MLVFTLLLNRVHVFANFMFNLKGVHGLERIKSGVGSLTRHRGIQITHVSSSICTTLFCETLISLGLFFCTFRHCGHDNDPDTAAGHCTL